MAMLQLRYDTPNHPVKELVVEYDNDYDLQCWRTNEYDQFSDAPQWRYYKKVHILADSIMQRGHTGGTTEGIINELLMLAAFQRMLVRTRELEDEVLEYETRDAVKYQETHPDEF